ncbi:terminase small subunit [Priestia aryabhattai]|uniref:terminase small subunit n=1 Tax=Priestia aryabhattai TaxID=412384 RepID=UPI002E1A6D84|nr:terminase small subunit [Priestia aryabhattai]MED4257706.1 terminase small subunit [Priestia aryabhattai]
MKLTPKQQRFVEEYLVDLNATQAALRAGYSEKTARAIGQQNLTKLYIQQEIQKRMNKRSEKTEITAERILEELGAIAFQDVNNVVTIETREEKIRGKLIKEATEEDPAVYEEKMRSYQHVIVKDTSELTPSQRKSIASIKEGKYGIEVKFYDKIRAIELLGKHLSMFTEKVEHSGTVTNQNVDMSALGLEELRKLAKLDE